ncbi:MAG: GyrI-like domain-containing protein [Candidatus Geothermincolia bacterium]
MHEAIVMKAMPAQPVVAIRERTTLSGLPQLLQDAFGELFPYVFRSGASPAGPPFVIYHGDFDEGDVDAEICVPIPHALAGEGRISSYDLPATQALSLTHVGSYDTISEAYESLVEAVEDRGLRLVGAPREVYLVGPGQGQGPEGFRTEIIMPVA